MTERKQIFISCALKKNYFETIHRIYMTLIDDIFLSLLVQSLINSINFAHASMEIFTVSLSVLLVYKWPQSHSTLENLQ